MSDQPRLTVLVTIHGIGFQQAPIDGVPGYADGLHSRLSGLLGPDMLGDDPGRERAAAGENGAVYVQSHWPPGSGSTEPGLARLGRWDPAHPREVLVDRAPLAPEGARIAHVALVYSALETIGPQVGPALDISERALANIAHYEPVAQLASSLFADLRALGGGARTDTPPSGMRVRSDLPPRHHAFLHRGTPPDQPSGLLATLRQLEDDVASYVVRNDLRERVRAFARDAVLRICRRPDVAWVVVNGHSQGTVLAYDTLRVLAPDAIGRVRALVTAGSPLRKYRDLFAWGDEAGAVAAVPRWLNFFDRADPVADPLALRNRAERVGEGAQQTLFEHVDPETGTLSAVTVDDVVVDNLTKSAPGGLRAHNYWDNQEQFVAPLAELLRGVAGSSA